MAHALLAVFLAPGNLAANLAHATADDDRMMIRTLVNMLVWNLALVIGTYLVF